MTTETKRKPSAATLAKRASCKYIDACAVYDKAAVGFDTAKARLKKASAEMAKAGEACEKLGLPVRANAPATSTNEN
jgi:hypothetical protein